MRYTVALVSGAVLAVLPLLMLVFPYVAWDVAYGKVLENPPASWAVGGFVENRCEIVDEKVAPLPVRLLGVGILAIGCAISGALAARIAKERRLAVAFLAPSLGYVVLLISDALYMPALSLGLLAGLFGILGASRQYLTNAWSATRSKQRAPQA